MSQHSKRTRAPALQPVLPPVPQPVPPRPPHLVQRPFHPFLPSAFTHGPGSWIPPRSPQSSVAPSSASSWLAGLQQPSVAGDSAQGPCWAPAADIGGSASPWYMTPILKHGDWILTHLVVSSVSLRTHQAKNKP